MTYIPLNYEKLNNVVGHYRPSTEKARNNRSFGFWERALFQRANSILEFDFPEDWHGNIKDFIIYVLFKNGYGVVSKDAKFGTYFQPCTLNGYDFYYQPTEAIISNPLLNKKLEIGKDCQLIKLTPDYMGIWDIIDYYAEKLSLLDNAINISLINNKYSWIVGAKNKSAGQALKKIFDLQNQGEPLIVYNQRISDDMQTKSEPFQFLDFNNSKERYLTPLQLQDFQTILNSFDCEIGIPTVPYQKKERMITDEANSKQIESIARCTVWLESLQNSIELVNDMYDLNISVKLRFDNALEVTNNELSENNDIIV